MNGITLPMMSMEARPDNPRRRWPACVVAMTRVMPNCFSGASAMVSTMVEQFGLVTICPFQPRVLLLAGNQLQVIRIDLRHEQRHVAIHAMVARIRNHDVAGLREGLFDFGGDRRIHGGKQQLRRIAGLAFLDLEIRDVVGRRAAQMPIRGFAYTACRRSGRSRPAT